MMAKRFGRNQSRKVREQLASVERELGAVKSTYHELARENARLKQRLRNAIEIDVETLRDHARMHYEASIHAHKAGYEGLQIMQRLDDRRIFECREKERFVRDVASHMAESIMRAIGQRW